MSFACRNPACRFDHIVVVQLQSLRQGLADGGFSRDTGRRNGAWAPLGEKLEFRDVIVLYPDAHPHEITTHGITHGSHSIRAFDLADISGMQEVVNHRLVVIDVTGIHLIRLVGMFLRQRPAPPYAAWCFD